MNAVVVVAAEELSVVGCGELNLEVGDREGGVVEAAEDLREEGRDTLGEDIAEVGEVEEDAGAAITGFDLMGSPGAHDARGGEVGTALPGVVHEILVFL